MTLPAITRNTRNVSRDIFIYHGPSLRDRLADRLAKKVYTYTGNRPMFVNQDFNIPHAVARRSLLVVPGFKLSQFPAINYKKIQELVAGGCNYLGIQTGAAVACQAIYPKKLGLTTMGLLPKVKALHASGGYFFTPVATKTFDAATTVLNGYGGKFASSVLSHTDSNSTVVLLGGQIDMLQLNNFLHVVG